LIGYFDQSQYLVYQKFQYFEEFFILFDDRIYFSFGKF